MAVAHTQRTQVVLLKHLQNLRQSRWTLSSRGISHKHALAHVSGLRRGRTGFRKAPDVERRSAARARYRSRAIGRTDSLVAHQSWRSVDCWMASTQQCGCTCRVSGKV